MFDQKNLLNQINSLNPNERKSFIGNVVKNFSNDQKNAIRYVLEQKKNGNALNNKELDACQFSEEDDYVLNLLKGDL